MITLPLSKQVLASTLQSRLQIKLCTRRWPNYLNQTLKWLAYPRVIRTKLKFISRWCAILTWCALELTKRIWRLKLRWIDFTRRWWSVAASKTSRSKTTKTPLLKLGKTNVVSNKKTVSFGSTKPNGNGKKRSKSKTSLTTLKLSGILRSQNAKPKKRNKERKCTRT